MVQLQRHFYQDITSIKRKEAKMKHCFSLELVNSFTNVKAMYCSVCSRSSFSLPERCLPLLPPPQVNNNLNYQIIMEKLTCW